MKLLKTFNLALRAVMEAGIVAGLAYWGLQFGETTLTKITFFVAAPALIFGFWGLYDFHNFGKWSEFLRLIQELILSFIAAFALYTSGQHLLGWILAVISVVHHIFIYLLAETLLKNQN
jgi:Protein of unknown function (DUF2568)